MKKIILSLVLLVSTSICADVMNAALNQEGTPMLDPEGGKTVRTRITGIDPDNPDPARSTYNYAMDFGSPRAANPSTYNEMRKLYY